MFHLLASSGLKVERMESTMLMACSISASFTLSGGRKRMAWPPAPTTRDPASKLFDKGNRITFESECQHQPASTNFRNQIWILGNELSKFLVKYCAFVPAGRNQIFSFSTSSTAWAAEQARGEPPNVVP